MKINSRFSSVLRITSFIAACCVVMIHANSVHCVTDPARWNLWVHQFFCQTLTCWAVPYFFAISGFFFALSDYANGGGYKKLMVKKIKGLLVPYALWICIATVLALPLIVFNNWYTNRPLTERTVLSATGLWDFINQMFAILRKSPKHLGVLWYVRALLVLFALAPVWRIFLRKSLAWLFLIAWVWLWLFAPNLDWHGIQFEVRRTSFFFLGMAAAIYLPLKSRDESKGLKESLTPLPRFVNYSFWIYCTHNIFLSYIHAGGHFVFGKGNIAIAVLTPASTIMAILLGVASANLMRNKFPTVFTALNGGR